ncbi:MAG TPA: dihydropteroate synthase [Thermoanaerobaculia bacterium]|nr:dihydropteroate synthase [Thermoanaerobaculia bacterium]
MTFRPTPLSTGRLLDFGPVGGVMAILNVTPDSFSDGGRLAAPRAAVEAGLRFADAGAAILDVGGESTRPRGAAYGDGAGEVTVDEELARVLPVIEGIRAANPSIPISIDTRRVDVARRALDAGADVVNLVTGLDPPDGLLALVAERDAAIILNHMRGIPATTFEVSRFGPDVVADVAGDLANARRRGLDAGIRPERLFVDPGLGFGKSADQNFALLAGLALLAPEGVPVVVGASRKAFLGSHSGKPPAERLPESLAACAVAAQELRGRNPLLLRVHDVEETLRFLAVLGRTDAPSHA